MSGLNVVCKSCEKECKNEHIVYSDNRCKCEYYQPRKNSVSILNNFGIG